MLKKTQPKPKPKTKKTKNENESFKALSKAQKETKKSFGIHALSDTEIDRYGRDMFQTKWRGCFAQDQPVDAKPGYYIINNDISTGPGEHWVGMYITKGAAYIYDSFARDHKSLLRHLTKRLASRKIKIYASDRSDKEQGITEIICGHLSLAWLHVIKDLGIRRAILI